MTPSNIDTRLSIICREVSKSTGEIATYVCKNEISENDVNYYHFRGMLNPELSFYVVYTQVVENQEDLETLLSFLRRRELSESDIVNLDGIVRL